jgi:hypothetical protein
LYLIDAHCNYGSIAAKYCLGNTVLAIWQRHLGIAYCLPSLSPKDHKSTKCEIKFTVSINTVFCARIVGFKYASLYFTVCRHYQVVFGRLRSPLMMFISDSTGFEVRLIGNKGMPEIPLMLKVDVARFYALVQGAGSSLRMAVALQVSSDGPYVSYFNYGLESHFS